jgi:hypothetical protein
MKYFLSAALLLVMSSPSFSQVMPLTLEPDGGNRKASVSEQVGIVKISINYNRPGIKGREGQIWNTRVAHYGFVDLGHGTSNAAHYFIVAFNPNWVLPLPGHLCFAGTIL